MRCKWRGIDAQVIECNLDDHPDLASADIVLLGGGSDREQQIVCTRLQKIRRNLNDYVEDGGSLLAICGGYQLLGHSYLMGEERLQGLSLVDLDTGRASPRLIGNVAIRSRIAAEPIVGYENHGGRTTLGPGVESLGEVVFGHGNDGKSGQEGCLWRNVVGTYIHGPLLPKNPAFADLLLRTALARRYGTAELAPLDDRLADMAHAEMAARLERGRA
jgi:CobQ-like glutamine amidotransferase family enzyme